jgi:hypothetical protein
MLESPLASHDLVSGPTPAQMASRPQAAQPPPMAGGAPEAQGGPSEFTKMFKAPPAAPAPAPEAKVVKKPAGRLPIPKKKTNYVLWILIGLAVVLLLTLILYLFLRK